jgi:PAS domain S-box-containing protein
MNASIGSITRKVRGFHPATITILGVCLLLGVALVDYFRPAAMSFRALYLLVIIFVAWGAGKGPGLLLSGLSMAAVLILRLGMLPAQPWWMLTWNGSLTLAAFSGVGWLAAEAGRLTRDMQAVIDDRTARWHEEAERHKATSAQLSETLTRYQQAAATQEAFLALGAKLSLTRTPLEAARAILASADQLWKWDAATLDLYVPEEGRIYPIVAYDVVNDVRCEVPLPLKPGPPTKRMRRILKDGPQLIVRQQGDTTPLSEIPFGDQSRLSASIMAVPLRREGASVGFISIQSYTFNAYSPTDLRALQGLADHCGAALERIRAEEALRQAQESLELRVRERTAELQTANAVLKAVTEGTDNLICVKDAQGRILLANGAMCCFLGKPESELVGTDDLESFSDQQQAAQIREHDRRIMATGRSESVEEAINQTGRHWHCLFRKSPFRDADGRIIGVVGVGVDITERKQMEQALRDSEQALRDARDQLERRVAERTAELESANAALREGEETLRAFLNALPEPAALVDHELKLLLANSAAARRLGRPMEAILGKRAADLFPPAGVKARHDVFDRVAATGDVAQFEDSLNGRHFLNFVSPIRDSDGRLSRAAVLAFDITERKEAERRLADALDLNRTLIQASPIGITVYRESGECILANEALSRITGGSVEQLMGTNFRQLASWRECGALERATEVLATGRPWQGECRFVSTFGKECTVQFQLAAFVSSAELHLLSVVMDIADRRRAEALLLAKRDLGVRLSLTSDLGQALGELLDIVTQFDGIDSGGVYLIQPPGGGMNRVAQRGMLVTLDGASTYWPPDSPPMRLALAGRPVFAPCENLLLPLDASEIQACLRGAALVPLSHDRTVIGALVVASHTLDEIPSQTRVVIESVAAQASGAIARIQAEKERSRLERQLLEISDREQARMGQDIHDGLCQQLVTLGFDANALEQQLTRAARPEAQLAGRMARLVDEAITESRQLSRGLFPIRLEGEGLGPALEELAGVASQRFGVHCQVAATEPVHIQSSTVATHLYRIAQEAVNNAAKHSRAREISIRLEEQADGIELVVEDNGAGLSSQDLWRSQGMGMHTMDYRARSMGGSLRLSRAEQGGTRVTCRVPLGAAAGG